MPNPIIGLAGLSTLGGVASAKAQQNAASDASAAQVQSAQMGIKEQRRQFDSIVKLMSPYVQAGGKGLSGMLALSGLGGAEAEQAAINRIEQSPTFGALVQQGENALLQNASATGGLRGGNTQAALAQFRPAMLAQQIDAQYGRLGGFAQSGQAAAANQAGFGQSAGANITTLLGQQGQALAGNALAQGTATANMWGNLAGTAGQLAGMIPQPAGASITGRWGI